MNSLKRRLLEPDESDPVIIRHADGASPFFLTCDHAGRRIPKTLGDMGLPAAEFDRHIAWDIGMAVVSRLVSDALDASLVEQVYSRLVIDCNRDPTVPSAIPEVSELTPIPANVGISPPERRPGIEEVLVFTRRLSRTSTTGGPPKGARRCWWPCIPSPRSSKAS